MGIQLKECGKCNEVFPTKKMFENCHAEFCCDCNDYHRGYICEKCFKTFFGRCQCVLCVEPIKIRKLTKVDKYRLMRALELAYRQVGMYPKGSSQYTHFKKLEKAGYLQFKTFGYSFDKKQVPLYYLTHEGKNLARLVKYWETH